MKILKKSIKKKNLEYFVWVISGSKTTDFSDKDIVYIKRVYG